MDCLCNYVHQRPVLEVQEGPGGPPEALLPLFMSLASPLLGLRKEVGDSLKGEAPFLPTPLLWHSCPWPGWGWGGLGVWAGHPQSLPQLIWEAVPLTLK